MDSSIGWLLDVTIEQNRATMWIKTIDGKNLKLIENLSTQFLCSAKE
jgi:hypothetical protein